MISGFWGTGILLLNKEEVLEGVGTSQDQLSESAEQLLGEEAEAGLAFDVLARGDDEAGEEAVFIGGGEAQVGLGLGQAEGFGRGAG